MKTFKITLTGEFNETHEIFVLSSVDLSNYEKHKDRINKIIINEFLVPCLYPNVVLTF